jgi:hypothetical protein
LPGTVPVVGLPALAFKNYLGTFIAVFTRFFDDVATFVLDKNGERLIAAHLDRTLGTIASEMRPGDRLIIAAHSLGSVVTHNYVVRKWAARSAPFPHTLITFGSPIGLLSWVWLYLDFEDMDFARRISADTYFCWDPVSATPGAPRAPLSWLNVVNCVDPIATAFPVDTVDLSATPAQVATGLDGGTVAHRFHGDASFTAIGASHTRYIHDKDGFLQILLRASGLAVGSASAVADARPRAGNWQRGTRLLAIGRTALWLLAVACVSGYCALVAWRFDDWRLVWLAILFGWPSLTIGVLAFWQRLLLGGPTKRVTPSLIRTLHMTDIVSFPYRVRERVRRAVLGDREVDAMAPSAGYLTRVAAQALASLPTLALMTLPIVAGAWLTGRWPTWGEAWQRLRSMDTLLALGAFMLYVSACALHELVRMWRRVLQIAT